MKGVFLVLAATVLHCCRQTTAGGTLSFLTLYSYSSLYEDDDLSSYISTEGTFEFGTSSVQGVYVSTNGYITMGTSLAYSPSIPGTSSIVAPYSADIDPSTGGSVRYTDFMDISQLYTVSYFIRSQSNADFYGTRMMIAEWDSVPEFGGSDYTTVSFQAVLITDGYSSYAVFIYDCGGMEWGGATIGWQYSSSLYREHYLSGLSSASIGCQYSSTYSAIVYRLDSPCAYNEFMCDSGDCEYESYQCDGYDDCSDESDEQNCESPACDSYEFECDNGECIYDSYECDDFDDCGDNSDEENCVNVGLAVGLSVGLFFFFLVIAIPICIFFAVCYTSNKRSRAVRTRVVATTPAAGSTTVVSSATNASTAFPPAPTGYPMQYPLQQQQPLYKDAQLSCHAPPPSYDAAVAFPAQPYVQSGYSSAPVPYPNPGYPQSTQAPPPPATYPNPGYPQSTQGPPPPPAPYPNPGYPQSTQALPPPPARQPTGVATNAGFLLQQ